MSRAFLTNIDLSQNELLNAVIQNLATAPADPIEGQIYCNTADHNIYVWLNGVWETWVNAALLGAASGVATLNGSSLVVQNPANAVTTAAADKIPLADGTGKIDTGWLKTGSGNGLDADTVDGAHAAGLRDRATHTGTQTASTISDFDTQVRTSRLDQMAAPTASVSLNNQKITNLATPVLGTDAANKDYVDSVSQGLDPKQSVKAATTAAIVLNGPLNVDGVSLIAGDRVLVKNQGAVSEVSAINLTGLTAAGLSGKYFTIDSPTVPYYVWFDLDDGSTDPAVGGKTGIEVNIATGDSDADIAGKVQAVLNVHSAFSATLSTATVNVTNLVGGPATDATAGDSGAVASTTVQGASAGAANGVYIVQAGAWTRALDTDTWNELFSAYVFVEQGTQNADSGWLCTVDAGGTLNTDSVTWVQFSQAGTVTAANVGSGEIEIFKQKNGATLEFRTINDTTSVDVVQTGDVITFNVLPGGINMNNLGGGPLSVLNGGTGASTAAGAKTNLGFTTKYAEDIGDGVAKVFVITHSLNSRDVVVQVRQNSSPYAVVEPDIENSTVNTTTLRFNKAPTVAQYRVVIIG